MVMLHLKIAKWNCDMSNSDVVESTEDDWYPGRPDELQTTEICRKIEDTVIHSRQIKLPRTVIDKGIEVIINSSYGYWGRHLIDALAEDPLSKQLPALLKPIHHHGLKAFVWPNTWMGFISVTLIRLLKNSTYWIIHLGHPPWPTGHVRGHSQIGSKNPNSSSEEGLCSVILHDTNFNGDYFEKWFRVYTLSSVQWTVCVPWQEEPLTQ
jgi:hypothetical protein